MATLAEKRDQAARTALATRQASARPESGSIPADTPLGTAPPDDQREIALQNPEGRIAGLFRQAGIDILGDELRALSELPDDGQYREALLLRAQRRHGKKVPLLAGPGATPPVKLAKHELMDPEGMIGHQSPRDSGRPSIDLPKFPF